VAFVSLDDSAAAEVVAVVRLLGGRLAQWAEADFVLAEGEGVVAGTE